MQLPPPYLQIPISTKTRLCQLPKGLAISKSAVRFRNFQGRTLLVSGFALSQDQYEGKCRSRFEVLEHLFAMFDFQSEKVKQMGFIESFDLSTNSSCGTICASEVLLGPVPWPQMSVMDASGLGFHFSAEKAIEHAVQELIERHYLALVWYRGMEVVEIGIPLDCSNGFVLRHFTIFNSIILPMVISTLENKEQTVWICGSAIRESFEQAKIKADFEAYMLLDNLLHETGHPGYEYDNIQRLNSLCTPLSNIRSKFFEAKIKGQLSWEEIANIKIGFKELASMSVGTGSVRYSFLSPNEGYSLVRAHADNLLKIRQIRELVKNYDGIPEDPFC